MGTVSFHGYCRVGMHAPIRTMSDKRHGEACMCCAKVRTFESDTTHTRLVLAVCPECTVTFTLEYFCIPLRRRRALQRNAEVLECECNRALRCNALLRRSLLVELQRTSTDIEGRSQTLWRRSIHTVLWVRRRTHSWSCTCIRVIRWSRCRTCRQILSALHVPVRVAQ